MSENNEKYLALLAKVLTKNASSEEKQDLDNWTKEKDENNAFAKKVQKTWMLTERYAEELPIDTNAAWAKFEQKIAVPTTKTASSSSKIVELFKTWQAAAAVLLVTLSVWFVYDFNRSRLTEIATIAGEQKEIKLPDGSLITLNENSTLAYAPDFNNRVVQLEGEAFFDVAKQVGKTFEILTNTTKTTVLGTSFNIRAYPQDNRIEVAVYTGKVAFETLAKASDKMLLKANETAVFDGKSNKINKVAASDSNAIAWKTQLLHFDNTSLKDLIEVLERHFDVEIKSENAAVLNCHFTGRFEQPQLQQIFDAVAFSTEVEIKKVDKQYILIGKGCE
jgi:transmembrane sensor